MKLEHLNLGKPLSRDEQKQIKGGYPLCNEGQQIECVCSNGGVSGPVVTDPAGEECWYWCVYQANECEINNLGTFVTCGCSGL